MGRVGQHAPRECGGHGMDKDLEAGFQVCPAIEAQVGVAGSRCGCPHPGLRAGLRLEQFFPDNRCVES